MTWDIFHASTAYCTKSYRQLFVSVPCTVRISPSRAPCEQARVGRGPSVGEIAQCEVKGSQCWNDEKYRRDFLRATQTPQVVSGSRGVAARASSYVIKKVSKLVWTSCKKKKCNIRLLAAWQACLRLQPRGGGWRVVARRL